MRGITGRGTEGDQDPYHPGQVQSAAPHKGEDWKSRQEEQHDVPWTTAVILPPGQWKVWVPGAGWHQGLGLPSGAEVAFTDRLGVHWVRRGEGTLEELPVSPLEHYQPFGFYGPYDFQQPHQWTERHSGLPEQSPQGQPKDEV